MRQLRTHLLCYIRLETCLCLFVFPLLFVCLPHHSPHMTQHSQLILVMILKDQSTKEEKKSSHGKHKTKQKRQTSQQSFCAWFGSGTARITSLPVVYCDPHHQKSSTQFTIP